VSVACTGQLRSQFLVRPAIGLGYRSLLGCQLVEDGARSPGGACSKAAPPPIASRRAVRYEDCCRTSGRPARVAEDERDGLFGQRHRRDRPRRCRRGVSGCVRKRIPTDVRPARPRLRSQRGLAATGLRTGDEPWRYAGHLYAGAVCDQPRRGEQGCGRLGLSRGSRLVGLAFRAERKTVDKIVDRLRFHP
jgi:hypothetical protein